MMVQAFAPLGSVCVYCGSSNAADPAYLQAAQDFGRLLADAEVRLVYGGGGVGLMGSCARAAHDAGGAVLGVMPRFLQGREGMYDAVETVLVDTMHERKMIMFDQADGFAVFPGGIGTLEEVVELMSWRRLALHNKPIVFYSPGGFWDPLFALLQHTVDEKLTPADFLSTFTAVEDVGLILPALNDLARRAWPQQEDAAKAVM
jgi:uncharacterized protein (TIGR00730 family)